VDDILVVVPGRRLAWFGRCLGVLLQRIGRPGSVEIGLL
jgi:hypothetical protein